MKTFLFSFLALVSALAFTPLPAHATTSSATTSSATAVRIQFSAGAATAVDLFGNLACINCGNVGVTTWVDLVHSTSKAIKGVQIYNAGWVPFQVAVGASGSEVVQMVVPPSHLSDGNGGAPQIFSGNPGYVFYPIAISQGQKVSIRALNSSATGGELEATFYYY